MHTELTMSCVGANPAALMGGGGHPQVPESSANVCVCAHNESNETHTHKHRLCYRTVTPAPSLLRPRRVHTAHSDEEFPPRALPRFTSTQKSEWTGTGPIVTAGNTGVGGAPPPAHPRLPGLLRETGRGYERAGDLLRLCRRELGSALQGLCSCFTRQNQ